MSRPSFANGKIGPLNNGSLPEDPRGKVVAFALTLMAGLVFLFFWKGSFETGPREFIPPLYPRPEPVEKRETDWEPSVQLRNADGLEAQIRFAPDIRFKPEDLGRPDADPRQTFSRIKDAPQPRK